MVTNYCQGLLAEDQASNYLLNKGYIIIAKRYKTKFGEIDLIAKKHNTIVFVEVKYRKRFFDTYYSITDNQKNRLYNAANYFLTLLEHEVEKFEYRFDAILMDKDQIVHLDNILD